MALVREMAAGPPPTWKSVRNLHALKNFRADIMMHHALPGTSAGAGKSELGLRHVRALPCIMSEYDVSGATRYPAARCAA